MTGRLLPGPRRLAILTLVAFAVSACAPPGGSAWRPAQPARSSVAGLPGVVIIDREPAGTPGYDRSCAWGHACVFGPAWSDDVAVRLGHNGCDTRNDLLREALSDVLLRPGSHGCVVVSGTLRDPYTGAVVLFGKERADAVEIDHVMALAVAWNRGAVNWTPERRRDFANDPDELIVTTAAANRSKGDRTPAQWLPSAPTGRCLLAKRFLQVARKWELPITRTENDILAGILGSC